MSVRELESVPNLTRLYAKAAVTGIRGGDARLPEDAVAVRDVPIDRERLAAYDRVCGFGLRDRLPPTYPHLLAFPLTVELMARRAFPFALPGLVHVRNRIEQRRPIDAADRLDMAVRMDALRPHPKGRQFDVHATATVDGEEVWTETSTYLKRGSGDEAAETPPSLAHDGLRPAAVWTVPASTGRRYGAVSGDRNPIHLYPLTARLFGFRAPIAHGMWSKARCLAALEARLPDTLTVEVEFRKPVFLPSKVRFAVGGAGDGSAFALHAVKDEAPHLQGLVT